MEHSFVNLLFLHVFSRTLTKSKNIMIKRYRSKREKYFRKSVFFLEIVTFDKTNICKSLCENYATRVKLVCAEGLLKSGNCSGGQHMGGNKRNRLLSLSVSVSFKVFSFVPFFVLVSFFISFYWFLCFLTSATDVDFIETHFHFN
jgi:hypothetical protein